jgi:hypothetical protein
MLFPLPCLIILGGLGSSEPKQFTFLLERHKDETMNPGFDPSSVIQQLASNFVALLLVIFAVFILWFISLIDILRNEFKKDINKLVWFFTITIPVLGPMLYFFIGFDQKVEKDEDDEFSRRRWRK